MKKIFILTVLLIFALSANSQYFIKPVDCKGADAYVWKVGTYTMGNDMYNGNVIPQVIVTFNLYANELSTVALDSKQCVLPGNYDSAQVYNKTKLYCPFFQNAVLTTIPFIADTSDMVIPVSNDPIDSSTRFIEVTSYKRLIYCHSFLLDMNVHHFKNGISWIVPIKWDVNNTDVIVGSNVGEYNYFLNYMYQYNVMINNVMLTGIHYGDSNDQWNEINIKEGDKYVNGSWIK